MESSLDQPIVNKVAQSGIEVFDLSAFSPTHDVHAVDISPFLAGGLVLREKAFREAVAAHDWHAHADRLVALFCSTDAIVPSWAWMLVASKLDGIAARVTLGSPADALREHFSLAIRDFDWTRYDDAIVVVKGCGNSRVPESAYVEAMTALQKVARKVMFGEPCSSVPLWRRRTGA